jgi:hypothetical protein
VLLADKGDQQRADEIEEGGGRGDGGSRPAMDALEFREIDALSVEAERPSESRKNETNTDDPPAFISDRSFVIHLV